MMTETDLIETVKAIEDAVIQLDRRFFSVTKRAVIAALEDAYRWYKKSKERVRAKNRIEM